MAMVFIMFIYITHKLHKHLLLSFFLLNPIKMVYGVGRIFLCMSDTTLAG